MSEADHVDYSPSPGFTSGQKLALLFQFERADGMVRLAVADLRRHRPGGFENALAVVMPLLGYAFETVAKLTWALHHFQHEGEMPQLTDLKEAATFPTGEVPFRGERTPAGFGGHAVMRIVEDLVERVDHDSTQTLKELVGRPVHHGCLGLLTTFHGFTRYALIDELLDPERDEEMRFLGTVFSLQQIVMADYPNMYPGEAITYHHREFLPTLAAG